MQKRLQYQKPELNDAARLAIYKALKEREVLLQPDTVERNTIHSGQQIDLYHCRWSDSAFQIEAQWQEVFDELEASRRHSDPEFLLPSESTFDIAENLLHSFKLSGRMTPPEITLDGDGNLYLEWKSNNKKLSICLSDNVAGRYIYLGVGREYNAFPLTRTLLREAIDSYLT